MAWFPFWTGLITQSLSNLSVPTDIIGQKQFKQIFGFLNAGVRGFGVILQRNDEKFREVAETLDPEFRYILKPRT